MSTDPYAAPAADLEPARQADAGELAWRGARRVGVGRGAAWLVEAWAFFAACPWPWIGVSLIFVGLTLAMQLVPIIGAIASMALTPVFIAGLMRGCAAQTRGEALEVAHLFSAFSDPRLVSYLLLALLQAVILIGGAILIAGLAIGTLSVAELGAGDFSGLTSAAAMLPLLAGILLVAPILGLYYFAPTLIALGPLDLLPAIVESMTGAFKNILPILLFAIVSAIAIVIAMIPLMLGMLVLLPMLFIATFIAYRDIYTDAGNA